jgi:hypothetical protein
MTKPSTHGRGVVKTLGGFWLRASMALAVVAVVTSCVVGPATA